MTISQDVQINSLHDNSLIRNFTHITIPSEIWLRRDISIQAKALWAEIRSLHNKEKGGCFASDDYLQDFLQVKRSRLQEVLKELKDCGLLILISFNGRQAIRRAVVPEIEYFNPNQSGQQLSGKPDSSKISYPENRTPAIRDTGLPHYIENKEENKEYISKKNFSSPKIDNKISYGSHVKLTLAEYEALCKIHTLPFITELIENMNLYCQSLGKSYKCYYAAMQKWVKNPINKSRQPHLASHRKNSKLAFETECDDWTPKYKNKQGTPKDQEKP